MACAQVLGIWVIGWVKWRCGMSLPEGPAQATIVPNSRRLGNWAPGRQIEPKVHPQVLADRRQAARGEAQRIASAHGLVVELQPATT